MPYRRLTDPERLKSLLSAALVVESDLDLDATLRRFVSEAVRLSGARYGALGVLDESGTGLAQFVVSGMTHAQIARIGHSPTGKGVLGLLIADPKPIRLADIASHPASTGFPPGHPPMTSFLGVPIQLRDTVYGNLYLTDKQGAPEFTEEDVDLIRALSTAAGIAIENARLHEQVAKLAMADDRERIARDLHDTVIQRLFAIGLSLQSVVPPVSRAGAGGAAERIEEAITNLDDTIRQVRTAIFFLEAAPETRKGLRARILRVTAEAAVGLGFEPQVRFAGAIDSQVGEVTANALLASLQEMLLNVEKHARASTVVVDVTLEKGEVILGVVDNGAGLPASGPAGGGEGIAHLVSLATGLGGTCVLRNAPSGGSAVYWSAPA